MCDVQAQQMSSSGSTTAGTPDKSGRTGNPKVDPNDPRVRKLVYSMYRNMLTGCNDEANGIISQKDPSIVKEDLGVAPLLAALM